jgi:hypothetical protein
MHAEPDRRRLGSRPGDAMAAMRRKQDPIAFGKHAILGLAFDPEPRFT